MKKISMISLLLCIVTCLNAQPCSNFKSTSGKYSERNNLASAVQSELGGNYTVADWADLKNISNINAWISCMGLSDGQSFNILVNGKQVYAGDRQYFFAYFPSG
ncbi:MAG: hypothetical protein R6W78_08890, partial [Bacteroidales bacterium]